MWSLENTYEFGQLFMEIVAVPNYNIYTCILFIMC